MAGKQAQKTNTGKMNQRQMLLIGAVVLIVIALVVGAVMFFGGEKEAPAGDAAISGTYYVEIDVKDVGVIIAELYADKAPITVQNFLKLVDEKFYDGLTFHRIIDGFMVQGGDPLGNGYGGSEVNIKGEFIQNGVNNDLKHVRGVLSMARSAEPDSASSQFFIMHQAATHLDGAYAAFGKVISGIEVVDALCKNTPVQDYNGTVAKADQPVITAIRRIDKP